MSYDGDHLSDDCFLKLVSCSASMSGLVEFLLQNAPGFVFGEHDAGQTRVNQ
jgi:hypothetical protein